MANTSERVWDSDFQQSLIFDAMKDGGVTITVDVDDTETIRLDATQVRKLRLYLTRLERSQKA